MDGSAQRRPSTRASHRQSECTTCCTRADSKPVRSKALRSLPLVGSLGDRPPKVDAAGSESGPEGRQNETVAGREAALLVPLRQSDRDGRADRVPVAIEVEDDAVETKTEALGDRLDDTPAGLMRDEPGEGDARPVVAP